MKRRPIHPDDPHFAEPEIIPPGRPRRQARFGTTWTRLVVDENGFHRVSVTKIGPLGMLAVGALVALVSFLLVIFFLGAFILLLPLVGVLLATGIVMSLIHSFSRRRF